MEIKEKEELNQMEKVITAACKQIMKATKSITYEMPEVLKPGFQGDIVDLQSIWVSLESKKQLMMLDGEAEENGEG